MFASSKRLRASAVLALSLLAVAGCKQQQPQAAADAPVAKPKAALLRDLADYLG